MVVHSPLITGEPPALRFPMKYIMRESWWNPTSFFKINSCSHTLWGGLVCFKGTSNNNFENGGELKNIDPHKVFAKTGRCMVSVSYYQWDDQTNSWHVLIDPICTIQKNPNSIWMFPKIVIFSPSILGYHYFWKHLYINSCSMNWGLWGLSVAQAAQDTSGNLCIDI